MHAFTKKNKLLFLLLLKWKGFFYMVHRSHTESGFLGSRSNIVIELYYIGKQEQTNDISPSWTVEMNGKGMVTNHFCGLLSLHIAPDIWSKRQNWSKMKVTYSELTWCFVQRSVWHFELLRKCMKLLLLLKGNFITVNEEHFVWKTSWLSCYI